MGSNRGALPYYRLSHEGEALRLLVPLPAGEALWIAWMLKPGLSISGSDRNGLSVRIAPVTQSPERWRLFAADAVEHPGGTRGLGPDSLAPVSTRKALGRDQLRFAVRCEDGELLNTVGIVVATPALYARLSGQPAPPRSTASDAYTGWRLP